MTGQNPYVIIPGLRFGMPDPFMTHRLDILGVLRMAFEGAPNAIFVAEEDGAILQAVVVNNDMFTVPGGCAQSLLRTGSAE